MRSAAVIIEQTVEWKEKEIEDTHTNNLKNFVNIKRGVNPL